ncbi:unnamed protein product [Effrenium voratum]|uniref:Uncharacterized protein n=1 Tax=Effrenium voratum TaxID=2562239 RepID=A0AA36I9R4_9DINO|nr:unnamed protein product [Effrenium voratum]CAJ1457791.1 unnamed protein product [Effrenium voratum]
MDLCSKLRELEDFFYGCRNECDQKCVIDNHEVEILQGPSLGTPSFDFCPSGRADLTDLCTPRVSGGEMGLFKFLQRMCQHMKWGILDFQQGLWALARPRASSASANKCMPPFDRLHLWWLTKL